MERAGCSIEVGPGHAANGCALATLGCRVQKGRHKWLAGAGARRRFRVFDRNTSKASCSAQPPVHRSCCTDRLSRRALVPGACAIRALFMRWARGKAAPRTQAQGTHWCCHLSRLPGCYRTHAHDTCPSLTTLGRASVRLVYLTPVIGGHAHHLAGRTFRIVLRNSHARSRLYATEKGKLALAVNAISTLQAHIVCVLS